MLAADGTLNVRAPDGPTCARILALWAVSPPDPLDATCAGTSFPPILSAFRTGLDSGSAVDALARMDTRKAHIDFKNGVRPLPGHFGEALVWGTALVTKWRTRTRAWCDVSASAVLAGPPVTGMTVFLTRSLAKVLGIQRWSDVFAGNAQLAVAMTARPGR